MVIAEQLAHVRLLYTSMFPLDASLYVLVIVDLPKKRTVPLPKTFISTLSASMLLPTIPCLSVGSIRSVTSGAERSGITIGEFVIGMTSPPSPTNSPIVKSMESLAEIVWFQLKLSLPSDRARALASSNCCTVARHCR